MIFENFDDSITKFVGSPCTNSRKTYGIILTNELNEKE